MWMRASKVTLHLIQTYPQTGHMEFLKEVPSQIFPKVILFPPSFVKFVILIAIHERNSKRKRSKLLSRKGAIRVKLPVSREFLRR